MSSASDFTPLPVPRARSLGHTLPHVRRLMTLEWDKLFAEATEKDKKEDVDPDDAVCDCECKDNENDSEENENLENSEMPLNLCNKSKTVPNMSMHFDMSDNSLELSAEKHSGGAQCKKHEPSKQISCTVPNFQFNNYQDSVAYKSPDDDNKPIMKQCLDVKENNENDGMKSSLCNGIVSSGKNNRTPMKEVNNLESNVVVDKKNSFKNNQCTAEKHCKSPVIKTFQNKVVKDSSKLNENSNKITRSKHDEQKHANPPKPEENNKDKLEQNSDNKDGIRFAVPAAPVKTKTAGKAIVINGKSYQVLALLGKGGSSSVYLVLNSNNELLAVKCVKLSGVAENIKNDYLNEIQHLQRMQHSKHVIRLYDHQYMPSHKLLYAVMEKGDTDLSRFLKDKAASEEGITPELILYYWNEMLLAVKSIHDNNIIHRDLKPANFLLVSGRLKLIDFGIASSIQNEQTSILMDTQSGTFNFMSPEALLDLGSGSEIVLKIGRKSDVWSLGCILYYFLYKRTPYQDLVKPLQKIKAITDPNYVVKFPKLKGVPDILIESCKKCLIHDRKKRASIEELLDLKNKPLLTLSNVLSKLKVCLSEEEYIKAEKALREDIKEEN